MSFPRWVSWLFVIFLGYILVVGNFNTPEHASEVAAPIKQAAEKDFPALRSFTDKNRWLTAINPQYQPPEAACALPPVAEDLLPSTAIVLIEGSGEAAACGDEISALLVQWNANGKRLRVMEDAALVLGEQPGLDGLLVGMVPGEERLVTFTPAKKFSALPMLKPGVRQTLTVHRTDDGAVKPATP